MASPDCVMDISIKVHISLWDVLKLRIAGSKVRRMTEADREELKAEEEGEEKAKTDERNIL